jgi:Fe-S-cluster containining protein
LVAETSAMQLLILNNEKPDLCRDCGRCCKSDPGITHPRDWGHTRAERVEKIRQALTTGQWAIDWWEGDISKGPRLERIMWVRPAIIGHEGQLQHGSWGGTCTFLGPQGCSHTFEDRPFQCRDLVPMGQGNQRTCKGTTDKRTMAGVWRRHQSMMQEILQMRFSSYCVDDPIDEDPAYREEPEAEEGEDTQGLAV